MAADSDGSGVESLTTVVTCEGDLKDPEFPVKFELILDKLRVLLCEKEARNRLCVRKLEPWNSVRVTLAIPREAALRLRQLANEGSQQLRALGILSVQVEGDQVISLRIAGTFGQEPQEIVLRTGCQDTPGASSQSATTAGAAAVSGLARILTSATPSTSSQAVSSPHPLPSTSATVAEPPANIPADKVQFRSPNVVCPTDTQVPKVPAPVVPPTIPPPGAVQRNYNGPFPFASMTHAAQAIHSRENQSQITPPTQPPPPYPSQPSPSLAKPPLNPNSPNVAMSSPLLVNLLQNDGAPTQNKMLPPPVERKRVEDRVEVDLPPIIDSNSTNSAFIASTQTVVSTAAVKYPYSASPVPTTNSNIIQTSARPVGLRIPPQFVQQQQLQQKVNTQVPVPVRPLLQQQLSAATQSQPVRTLRPPIPNQKFPAASTVVANVSGNNQFGSPFPRQNFRGQLTQYNVQQTHFQQFPSPPPYPRQRMETVNVRPNYQDISRFQQHRLQTTWQQHQFQHIDTPGSSMQPIAQPMPHLLPLNSVLENSLSNITPSLTDLSKTDLDSLLPSLEGELDNTNTSDLPDIPETLTSTGKRRQYLINPLTGVLEPMPSDSSASESEPDEAKESDIFNDFNSPLNDRSNSIYSDDDTCSTTISRKFDTTDQSDSEATVKSTNSENSVKSHQRIKSGKTRDRNRDSPSLKKNKDLPTEKIKLRLKLEKSEPVSPAYKVDISYTQQPKRATQNVTRPPSVPCSTTPPAGEELRVPPLHISLRGRNSVVINSEKKKKHPKLNADGSIMEMKKSKKTVDGLKVKKSMSAKDLSVKSGSLLTGTLSKSESSLVTQKTGLIKTDLILPSTSTSTFEQKNASEVKITSDILKSDVKIIKSKPSDLDDLPLNYRMREPGEIVPTAKVISKPLVTVDLKKSKKSNKFNHMDLYREQHLLSGGHLVDDYKSHKKVKSDDKVALKNSHKSSEHSAKINSHFKKDKVKDKLGKDRSLPGHVGEIRRGSDSDVVKGLKRHADSNGLSHTEKKRRLSQSEGKTPTVTESQGVNKSVKLKSSSPDGRISALSQYSTSVHPAVVGSTNVGTISNMTNNKTIAKPATGGKLQKSVTKVKRDKGASFGKTKDGNFKSKDLNRDKTYAQNVAEKLAKQLPLPTGEIDMEAKFKKSLLESSSEIPRRHLQSDRKSKTDTQKLISSDIQSQLDRVTDLVQTLSDRDASRGEINPKASEFPERQKSTEQENAKCVKKQNAVSPTRKSTDTDLPPTQRLDDKQSGRSPNSGGQGEDSGIESMDALSEKSPNQASQSPHSHTEITLTDPAVTVKVETKLENCLPDLLDIEEQLAKMDGLPTLNGDLSHMIKTEPFMKTETLIEKLEGTEGKDLNENKEVKEAILDECCDQKVQTTDCKVDISDLPLNAAMQQSLKQGNISVTTRTIELGISDKMHEKNQPELEISLVSRKTDECKPSHSTKEMDFDPLPIRRKPPLYTYSNPEKQSRDSDSPIPNLSDLEYNSDSNSECSELKSKISQKAATVTRRRKQNLDNLQLNDSELDACLEAMNTGHFLTELSGFKKNDVKKPPKSLLEQLLIEIPIEVSEKQASSTSPSVSEKNLNTSKSSIRTRSSSKLNSPDISESSKSEKSLKTARHSPGILKQDSPANSPVLCSSKNSPKCAKVMGMPTKRKRQESESSTQSNVSLDEAGNNIRHKKARKCSENAVELIKACMGVDNCADSSGTNPKSVTVKATALKDVKKHAVVDKNSKLLSGLLRKSQVVDLESSDSDEPLIEIAGKVRNKHVATRNKLNSTKSNIPTPLKSVPVVSKVIGSGEEKMVGTRRSVRNSATVPSVGAPVVFKTRSKHQLVAATTTATLVDKGTAASGVVAAVNLISSEGDVNNRRKTRSAVSDDVKRRRNSRDGK